MWLIPSIDLQRSHCVRLKQGKLNNTTIYQDTPQQRILKYAADGAIRLHVVDLDGAMAGKPQHQSLIQSLSFNNLAIQIGGGVRSLEHAQTWFNCGARRVVLGSIALSNQALTTSILHRIGADKIILAMDVRYENGIPIPQTQAWQFSSQTSLWDWAAYYQAVGVKEIVCTDITSDGMLQGPNFTLYQEALTRFPNIHWVASGGIRGRQDLFNLKHIGLSGAILGRALYEGTLNLKACIQELMSC